MDCGVDCGVDIGQVSATLVSSVLPSSLLHLRGEYYCFFVMQYGGEAVSGVPLGGRGRDWDSGCVPHSIYIYLGGLGQSA